eukprot:756481-Hanusia_phi.AAC.7
MFENLRLTEELYGVSEEENDEEECCSVLNGCLNDLELNLSLAAALYAQAADFNKTARFYYMKAQDAYYLANAQASYDDWRRSRRQWDYFYRRK